MSRTTYIWDSARGELVEKGEQQRRGRVEVGQPGAVDFHRGGQRRQRRQGAGERSEVGHAPVACQVEDGGVAGIVESAGGAGGHVR